MAVSQKVVNLFASRFLPALLFGIIGYASWAVTKIVCVDYLLNPPPAIHFPRPGPAIVILVVYYTLLFFVLVSYARLLYTVIVNPGYIPRGAAYYEHEQHFRKKEKEALMTGRKVGKIDGANGYPKTQSYPGTIFGGRPSSENWSDGLEDFYSKDVFVCEQDGRPIWCSMCTNWKPDRTHHCREVGRCVRKMDHFCPWVGGMVGEINFKFFIQLTSWVALECTLLVICLAFFIAEQRQKGGPNVHMIIVLAIAGLFGLFAVVMSITSLQFAILNVTSIENLSRKTKVWTLAVYMPHPPPPSIIASFQTITYPLNYLHASPSKNTTARTFAILHSKPGENPFYLGKYKNFQSVMGYGFLDWVLPLRYSPCCDHSSDESAFALGPAVQRMRKDAGINDSMSKGRRHRRRSRRHSRAGTGPPVNGDEIQEAKVEQGGSEMTTEGDGSLAK